MLNYQPASFEYKRRMGGNFPSPEKDEVPRPLPEDYNPEKLLTNGKIDEDEKYFEPTSMVGQRKERMLYLDYKIALQGQWLTCTPVHAR